MTSLWEYGVLFAGLCAVPFLWLDYKKRSRRNYFPSPPSEPILGHLRTFPQVRPWEAFAEWRKQYGGVIQLFIAGKSIIVLNDAEDAYNLMDRRGSKYSDRPRNVLVGEMTGLDGLLALTHYGDDFRTMRRWITQYFNSRDHIAMFPLLKGQVKILLENLLNDPENFHDHLDRLTSGTVVKSTYGHDIKSNNDDFVKMASEAVIAATSLGMMGLTPLDFVPILRHLPSWLPGASIIGRAKAAKVLVDRMMQEPFKQAASQRSNGGRNESCFVDYLLDDYQKLKKSDSHHEHLMENAAGQIYVAGAETSADTFLTFFLMMALHPEVQKKAQIEIDKVIGTDHLPTLEDRLNLPYIECVLKEVLRFNPSLPLGIPHALTEDDEYKGRFIPGGSMIISNIWGMMRDERYFPEPNKFYPDRFLKNLRIQEDDHVHILNTFKPDDPSSLVFGFGRRACPGRYFADASAWLTIANVLAIFKILPAIDPATGKEVMPKFDLVGGTTSRPKHFEARIVPRSEKHALLAQNA